MLEDLIDQLQSSDPAERRQAIIALGRGKNPGALPALEDASRNDPDPELRELARKAGAFIRQQTGNTIQSAMSAPPITYSEMKKDDSYASPSTPLRVYETPLPVAESSVSKQNIPVRGREYNVSKGDKERAHHYVESALSANMRGDDARAMKDLTQALKLNPNLINDSYFGSVAASVTGTSGDEAVRMIVDGQKRKDFVNDAASKVKQETKAAQLASAKQSTTGGVGFEMAIYVAINLFLPIIIAFAAFEVLRSQVGGLTEAEREAVGLAVDINPLLGLSIGGLVVSGFIFAVTLVISTLIQTFIIHLAAILLGGTGTFVHLLDVLLSFYNRYVPILYVLIGASLLIGSFTIGSFLIACLPIIVVLFTFYFLFKTASKVGEAYGSSAGMGCLTLIVATFVIGLLQALMIGVFGSAVGGLINQFIVT